MSNTYIKPPLGVAPHWFVYNNRMQELAKAITRFLEHISAHNCTLKADEYYMAIAEWSRELEVLALLEAEKEAENNG